MPLLAHTNGPNKLGIVINLKSALLIARVMACAADSRKTARNERCRQPVLCFDARAPIHLRPMQSGRSTHIAQSPSGKDRLTCQSRQGLA